MDYRGKTQEELLTGLLELQEKYDSLAEQFGKNLADLKHAKDALVESESKFSALRES